MPLARRAEDVGGAVWRRVTWLDAEIRAGRAPTRGQFLKRFDISEGCATQTIAYMKNVLGLPLEHDRSQGGYIYREEPPELPSSHPGLLLSGDEHAALLLATAMSRRYLHREAVQHLESLAQRLLAAAGRRAAGQQERWERNVVFTGPPPMRGRYLHEAMEAVVRRRLLLIDYQAPGHHGFLTRTLEPHFLNSAAGDWLIVAWDCDRDAPRTFALSRIVYADVLDEGFERRRELDAAAWTRHQFLSEGGREPYELVLRFDPSAAQVARERLWHPSQQDRTTADGRLELTLHVGGRGDVLRWLLGFGGAVEVVSPEWMRELLRETALRTADRNGRETPA